MRSSRWLSMGLLVAVVVGAAGCEATRRKFIRKRKAVQQEGPIFALENEYRPEFPPEVRYQAHFAYWKAAHDDLLEDLQQATVARRMRAAHQVLKELKAMQALLDGPPVAGLGKLIEETEQVVTQLENPVLDTLRIAAFQSRLESLYRRIDKGYDYHRVVTYVRADAPAAPNGQSAH